MRLFLLIAAAAAVPFIAQCSSTSNTIAPVPDAGVPDTSPTCDVHANAGTTFVDSTQDWGLAPIVGNRIASADLDGDGYPDLVIHAVSSNLRQKVGAPPVLVSVLMNRPRANGNGRQFVDATAESGFFQVRGGSTTEYRSAHLASFGDVDNDGDLDAFSGTYVDPTKAGTDPGDRSEIMLNDGKGKFTLAPTSDSHPQPTELWPTTGASMTDVDRDGKLDLWVGFWYQSYGASDLGTQAQLYKGKGDGTFQTITIPAGLQTKSGGYAQGLNHRPAYGITTCDVDGDGSPELLLSAYGRQWNLLYQNDGTGKFTEIGKPSGFASDSNVNYKDNQFFMCYCTVHPTKPDCQGVAPPDVQCPKPADAYWNVGSDDQPWRNGGNTFSTYCGDLNGDGKADLYSAEIHHWWAGGSGDSSELVRNTGDVGTISFDRPGNATTGMVWPHPTTDWNEGGLMVSGGDLDGDGREDLVVAASDYPDQFGLVFHQKPDHTFEEVGSKWGLHHACMSGLTIADFDRDGDLDVIVGSGTARDCIKTWKTNEVHLYENKGASAKKWLELRLTGNGTDTNRAGIGARVTVHAGGESIVKELVGSHGHMSAQDDTTLFFGLGACSYVNAIDVRWPNQALTVQTFKNVPSSRFVDLKQGVPDVTDVKLK